MTAPIKPEDIRKGDLIRWEGGHGSLTAVEYRAERGSQVHAFNGSHYLLDRPTPMVDLPTEPTLGWLNDSPHLLAIWKDTSEGSAYRYAISPQSPTPFTGEHIKSFTPAVAVPKDALDEFEAWATAARADGVPQTVFDFLAAVYDAGTDEPLAAWERDLLERSAGDDR